MTPALDAFIAWATAHGAAAEITQPAEGNGYTCLDLTIGSPEDPIDITVTEAS